MVDNINLLNSHQRSEVSALTSRDSEEIHVREI